MRYALFTWHILCPVNDEDHAANVLRAIDNAQALNIEAVLERREDGATRDEIEAVGVRILGPSVTLYDPTPEDPEAALEEHGWAP